MSEEDVVRADRQANWCLGLGLSSLLCLCFTGIPAIFAGLFAWNQTSPGVRWKLWVGMGAGAFGTIAAPLGARLNPDQAAPGAPVAEVAVVAPVLPVAPAAPPLPADEQAVCDIVQKYGTAYRNATRSGANEMKLSALRAERGAKLAAALPKRQATGWIGKIERISTTTQGNGHVAIQLPCGVTVATSNNELSDIMANTLIKPTSPLYMQVANLEDGQAVVFSATFVEDGRDHFLEQSLTELGSMTEPVYFGRFSAIASQ